MSESWSHLVYCLGLRIRADACQMLTDACLAFYLKYVIMEALYLYQISSSIGSLYLSIESFPGNVFISSFLQFKPIFAQCFVPHRWQEQSIPFWFLHCSFAVYYHSSFQALLLWTKSQFFHLFLVGSHFPGLWILCLLFSRPPSVFLVERAQSKAQCLNLGTAGAGWCSKSFEVSCSRLHSRSQW